MRSIQIFSACFVALGLAFAYAEDAKSSAPSSIKVTNAPAKHDTAKIAVKPAAKDSVPAKVAPMKKVMTDSMKGTMTPHRKHHAKMMDSTKASAAPAPSSTATVVPAVEEKPATGCSVAKMVFAPKLENHEPVGEAAELPASSGHIYCWTKLACGGAAMKVKHVWYMDGKKICEIPLSLKSGVGRSASSKTVVPGQWKVEVARESGEVIGSGEVTVK